MLGRVAAVGFFFLPFFWGCADSESPAGDTRASTGDLSAPDHQGDRHEAALPDLPVWPDIKSPDVFSPDTLPPDLGPVCKPQYKPCGTGTSVPCAPRDSCKQLYKGVGVRNWPVATDATGPAVNGYPGCKDSNGTTWPSIGVGSATWFSYLGCGSYKDYDVDTYCKFSLVSYNDCCSGCVLKNIDYEIQESIGGVWVGQKSIKYTYTGTCDSHTDSYTPTGAKVRIKMKQGFYICVFQE